MLFGFFYFDWTILIVLPAMIFAVIAQAKVQSTFHQFSRVPNRRGLTGSEAARQLLDASGLYDVGIQQVRGNLTDHYNPKDRMLYLSESVYNARSAAAVGVACHEAGHAIQHAEHYAPLSLRMSIIPVCNIGSTLAFPLFLIGLLFNSAMGDAFLLAGILCFSLATVFQLITLPVEFNASRRALQGIADHNILYSDELTGAKKVLSAAAMTYVAALATSLLSLLRILFIASRSRD